MANHRPEPSEYAPYFARYINLVPDGAIVDILRSQTDEYAALYRGITEQKAAHRYAPDKWSIKQVLGHLSDAERMFAFRGLAASRNERKPLPGFEQDDYVAAGAFDQRPWRDLVDEFLSVRAATVALYAGMSDDMLTRLGNANNADVSARACGFMIAGHERHHIKILKEHYL
jgi:DinB superfamily